MHSSTGSGAQRAIGNIVVKKGGTQQGQGRDERKQTTIGSGGAVREHLDAGHSSSTELYAIFEEVVKHGKHNAAGARRRVPSALNIDAWKKCLEKYSDGELIKYLEYGWPINFQRGAVLQSTMENHGSAAQYPCDVEHYICTELAHGALMGPFARPPVRPLHISPLMTKPKKNSKYRRVIMDLSWPAGGSVNEGVDGVNY